jgi:hypothetical protein
MGRQTLDEMALARMFAFIMYRFDSTSSIGNRLQNFDTKTMVGKNPRILVVEEREVHTAVQTQQVENKDKCLAALLSTPQAG